MAEERDEPARQPTRREVDAVFGEVLPDTTDDERDLESGGSDSDSWYLENRPPHHDR